ncbi:MULTISPECIES: dipeptide ABC transporter ATP-binding protein [Microbacterium]|uniref:ABC transporter ATP-binding protein n=1 Tax=Microbacterium barkeri TaxID=33917 RepID=A0A9W6H2E8_9MICO|nr:ABC transporter ATP-binding protein [Microbacterium barkeri]MDI6942868.1 ABC transporter ATP-binding protein [Microbacterium barkeri]MDR6877712.1 peptide/nickel transport system ATP-binding protein [Microbacterium barkeri]GLJ60869.1 ABC transporter ATP-binding protein [Microbacterium barkeri]
MSDDILRVEGLQVAYRTGRREVEAVRGVDLRVPRGGIVALVGESGSGKSSVSQALVRRLPENGRIAGGAVRFAGLDLARVRERELRRIRGGRIGFVPQDPNASLNPVLRIGEQIAEGLRLHVRMTRADAAARAVEILGEVGLSRPELRARQYPHELSGGMKQRVLIGMAWSCDPELVIADEPTSALDVTVQRRVLDQIEELAASRGTAVLLVTHDLGVAKDRADRVVVMQQGLVVDEGTTDEVLGSPRTGYTRELVAAAPGLTSRRLEPTIVGDSTPAPDGPPLLEIEGLRKTFGDVVAADGVSFAVPEGETVALVGESGSGKTTTARMAARIVDADGGRILFRGADITALRGAGLREWRREVQVVYQNPFGSLDPRMSIERIVSEPLRAFGIGSRAEQARRVRDLLASVRLPGDVAERLPAELSGGQRQRVAIARALALQPKMLVLDEPVSALDVSVQTQILQVLVDLQAQLGLGYLFITHDFGVVRQIADHVVVMRAGRVVEQGPASRMLVTPGSDYARELLEAVPGSVPSRR